MAITVKSALLEAARLLGISEEVTACVNGEGSVVGEQDTELLRTCFRMVETELALDYLPLMTEDDVITTAGVVHYSTFSRVPVRILRVEDQEGKLVKFRLYPQYMEIPSGWVKVYYTYEPKEKGLEEESEYQSEQALRMLAYGVASEYALATGELESAKAWGQKYKEAIERARRIHPCKQIRARRWC